MTSPQSGVGKTGPVWVPCPLGLTIESTSTALRVYGLLTADVAWQMVTFSCGAAYPAEGDIQPRRTTVIASAMTTAGRGVRCEPWLATLTLTPHLLLRPRSVVTRGTPVTRQPIEPGSSASKVVSASVSR